MVVSLFFIITIVLLITLSSSFMVPNYYKQKKFLCKTIVRFSEDESIRLEKCKSEILRCKKSWNPLHKFEVSGLEEEIRQLDQKRLEQKEDAIRKEQQRKESEKKSIFLCKSGEFYEMDKPLRKKINRKKFEDLIKIKPLKLKGDFGEFTIEVYDFDDLVDDETYLEYVPNEINYEVFSKNEAVIQTRDTVDVILSSEIIIPGFNVINCKVLYEYEITDPTIVNPIKTLGFGFPINPDAILISEDGETWVVLESKRSATKEYVNKFLKKINFLTVNKNKLFMLNDKLGVQKYPKYIIPVMSSILDFEKETDKLIRVRRDGLSYILV